MIDNWIYSRAMYYKMIPNPNRGFHQMNSPFFFFIFEVRFKSQTFKRDQVNSMLPSGTPSRLRSRRAKNCMTGSTSSRFRGRPSPRRGHRCSSTNSKTSLVRLTAVSDTAVWPSSRPANSKTGVRFLGPTVLAERGYGAPKDTTPPRDEASLPGRQSIGSFDDDDDDVDTVTAESGTGGGCDPNSLAATSAAMPPCPSPSIMISRGI